MNPWAWLRRLPGRWFGSRTRTGPGDGRPRLVLLADRPGWAFDHSARELARLLAPAWQVEVLYVVDRPRLDPGEYDILFIYFWGETWHLRFGCDPERTIKQVSSHRWEDDAAYGPCSPRQFAQRYLHDAATVTTTSERLLRLVSPVHSRVRHAPNGIDPVRFSFRMERRGELVIGWAGNGRDPVKRIDEVLVPAAVGYRLERTSARAHVEMGEFYNRVDVFCCSSRHEGEPLTLLEAMACGCFPVCADVGIVPELIRDGENGLIVRDPTPAGFAEAFSWCAAHLGQVRAAGRRNAEEMATRRSWQAMAPVLSDVFHDTLRRAALPRFRNDDVSFDTDAEQFRAFCSIFARHGYRQLHGVTLRGCTATRFRLGEDPVEYPGCPNLSRLPNRRIRELAEGQEFCRRRDLIESLNESSDEIALHGLYHTDHRQMLVAELRHDLKLGLEELREIFPRKDIRYFIPPFNRTSRRVSEVCAELGLHVLTADGVHLEAELDTVRLRPGAWHRYHHHRFYPESTFTYYRLSLDGLDAMFQRQSADIPRRGDAR